MLAACGAASAPRRPAPAEASRRPAEQLSRAGRALLGRLWAAQSAAAAAGRTERCGPRRRIRNFRAVPRRFTGPRAPLSRGGAIAIPRATPGSRNRALTYEYSRGSANWRSRASPTRPNCCRSIRYGRMPLLFAQTGAGAGQYAVLSAKDLRRLAGASRCLCALDQQAIAEHARRNAPRLYAAARARRGDAADARPRSARTRPPMCSISRSRPFPRPLSDRSAGCITDIAHRGGQGQDTALLPRAARFPAQRVSAAGADKRRSFGAAARAMPGMRS